MDLETEFDVTCPYCGEDAVIYLEPEVRGQIVQDCEVCCNPWLVTVTWESGDRYVQVARADGTD
jgi:cysteine-rich CPXCG protein